MKTLTYKGPRGIEIKAKNADERLRADFSARIAEAYANELQAFLEECRVAFRKLKPGETATIESRPIVVTMEKGDE